MPWASSNEAYEISATYGEACQTDVVCYHGSQWDHSVRVPDDWSIHRIGHELTALHGLDHAVTLAIVLPGQWKLLKEHKKEKLLQYAERIWKITKGSEEDRIAAAIEKLRISLNPRYKNTAFRLWDTARHD